MAWTSPRTWVAGEVVTAAMGNTHWRDNLNFLATFLSTGTLGTRSVLVGSGTAPIAAVGPLGLGDVVVGSGATAVPTAVSAFTGTIGSLYLKTAFGGLARDHSTVVKGGLPVGSATGTYGVLVIGGDGQVLKADSTQALGAKWANEAGVSIVVSASGTVGASLGTVGGILSTGTVNTLDPKDTLIVYYFLQTVSGNGSGTVCIQQGSTLGLYVVAPLAGNGTLGGNNLVVGRADLMMGRGTGSSHALISEVVGGAGSGYFTGTRTARFHQDTLLTSWTGSFALSLVAYFPDDNTGQLYWRWTVYKRPGT